MDQTERIENYSMNGIRFRLMAKLNEVRRTIILGDKDKLAQVLVELDLYQKTFDDLYEERLKYLNRSLRRPSLYLDVTVYCIGCILLNADVLTKKSQF